jgi:hypothetical protein
MLELPSYLTPLESAVISSMLEGSKDYGETLRLQLVESQLESREHNGYGFYTKFSVPVDVPTCSLVNEHFHASSLVGGELCGFILYIRDGRVAVLEGYPLGGDAWPQSESFEQVRLP